MKPFLICISIIMLRCCWGPTEYQLMQETQNDNTILKELNGTYIINTLNSEDVLDFNLNISFNDSTKQVSGFSGCNRFFGTYTLDKNSLKLGPLGATRKFCTENENNIESTLLKTLEKANVIFFTKDGIRLFHDKKPLLSATKETNTIATSISYMYSTRGMFKQINVDKNAISVQNKRNGDLLGTKCSSVQWQTLNNTLNAINIQNINTFEAPSKKFQFDGAAIAQVTIISNGKTYESLPFDHGNPPKELAPLVKEMLSLAQNIE